MGADSPGPSPGPPRRSHPLEGHPPNECAEENQRRLGQHAAEPQVGVLKRKEYLGFSFTTLTPRLFFGRFLVSPRSQSLLTAVSPRSQSLLTLLVDSLYSRCQCTLVVPAGGSWVVGRRGNDRGERVHGSCSRGTPRDGPRRRGRCGVSVVGGARTGWRTGGPSGGEAVV